MNSRVTMNTFLMSLLEKQQKQLDLLLSDQEKHGDAINNIDANLAEIKAESLPETCSLSEADSGSGDSDPEMMTSYDHLLIMDSLLRNMSTCRMI